MGAAALTLILVITLLWLIDREIAPADLGKAVLSLNTSNAERVNVQSGDVTMKSVDPILALMQAPLEFHGVVLDQNNDPVNSARVEASVLDNAPQGTSIIITADDHGRFSIKSKGSSIYIRVSKSGYYHVDKNGPLKSSSQGFDFGVDNGRGVYQPNVNSPVVFHLRKAGKPVFLNNLRGQSKVPRDGGLITLSLSKTSKASLQIKCLTLEDPKQLPNAPYDWRCEIAVAGGGIQEAMDEHTFLAPEEGYAESFVIDMPKTLDRKLWNSRARKNFWLRFPDNTFGRISFTMIARGDHFAVIQGFHNPTPKDLNLEPKLDER